MEIGLSSCSTPPLPDGDVLERLLAKAKFGELLKLSADICLSEPLPPADELPPPTKEQELVMRLGARGLRDALTMSRLYYQNGQPQFSPADEVTIRYPELFGWGQDPEILQQVELFGAALLDEAYTTLGEDAEEKIAAFREAKTLVEKIAVIRWLDGRLVDMSKVAAVRDEDLTYHSVRLSPKFIGRYPAINLPPTCLSNSIIAASFFRKAGAPVMHAGVMRTAFCDDIASLIHLTGMARDEIERFNGSETSLSLSLGNRHASMAEQLRSVLDLEGYHAVALVRLEESLWYQIDPNFNKTLPWLGRERGALDLDPVYDLLQEFRPTAPNLEIAVRGSYTSPVQVCAKEGFYQDNEVLIRARQSIAQELLARDTETLHIRLHDRLAALYRSMYDGKIDIATNHFNIFCTPDESSADPDSHANEGVAAQGSALLPNSFFGDCIKELIDKYVLYGRPVEEVVERCRRDEPYLWRRVDDVLSLPFAARAVVEVMLPGLAPHDIHTALEVGNAEMRVGFAVLNDMAAFFEKSNLRSTFWCSHWPSLIPASEGSSPVTEVERWMDYLARTQSLKYLSE